MEDEVLVSRQMLKAIGAESRINVLKALKERQKTQSELAKELGLSAPTVLEHMAQLEKAGLIERVPEDKERKWKYYRLTETSRKMLGKKRMSIVMMLASTSLAATAALFLLYIFTPLIVSALLGTSAQVSAPPPPPTGSGQIQYALTDLQTTSQSFLGFFIMISFLITIILGAIALWKMRRERI